MSDWDCLIARDVPPLSGLKAKHEKYAIIMFHGYGASKHDLYPLHQVIELSKNHSADWFFPNGEMSLGMSFAGESRAWFSIDVEQLQQAMMRGEHRSMKDTEPAELQDLLLKLQGWIINSFQDYKGVIVGGFSQGAMLTSHLVPMLCEHLKVPAIIFLSGQLIASERLQLALGQCAEHLSQSLVFASHGEHDPILSWQGGKQLLDCYQKLTLQCEWVNFPGQHEIPQIVIQKLNNFLQNLE